MRADVVDHVTFAVLPSAPEPDMTPESEAFALEFFELNQPPPAAAWTPACYPPLNPRCVLVLRSSKTIF